MLQIIGTWGYNTATSGTLLIMIPFHLVSPNSGKERLEWGSSNASSTAGWCASDAAHSLGQARSMIAGRDKTLQHLMSVMKMIKNHDSIRIKIIWCPPGVKLVHIISRNLHTQARSFFYSRYSPKLFWSFSILGSIIALQYLALLFFS